MTRIAFVGGAGRMGQALASGFSELLDFKVVALVDPGTPRDMFGATHVSSVESLDVDGVDVVIDFSHPDSVVRSAQWCGTNSKGLVVGTTGLSAEQRATVAASFTSSGAVIASNFSIGAVLSERFAAMAAPYFDRVEIIELHHDKKVDAPSGTSLTTAAAIRAARAAAGRFTPAEPTERFTLDHARGADAGDGIHVHSVRLPGLVAHQEILMGGPGEGLTIRHDSYDRVSFVQGVALAARNVGAITGLVEGIEQFLD